MPEGVSKFSVHIYCLWTKDLTWRLEHEQNGPPFADDVSKFILMNLYVCFSYLIHNQSEWFKQNQYIYIYME